MERAKNYLCQILETSGIHYESSHEDFFEALRNCIEGHQSSRHVSSAKLYKYPNLEEPIVVMRQIK